VIFCRRSGPRGFQCTKPRGHKGKHAARTMDGRLCCPRWTEPPFASLPRGFETWNPAMRGAYVTGRRARRDGEPIDACPYRDTRNTSGRLTWSRAFERAWVDGWNDDSLS
jgi:hypothetical protein